MILSHRKWGVLVMFFFVLFAFVSNAQPTLPDLTGSNESGIVLLSWTCQYDGVKSIAVLRSADSTFNYSTIGYVKKVLKGVQAYADGHPYPGRNFYKLAIVFNSGLTWTSNHFGVSIDSSQVNGRHLNISNDALQKMIVTETIEKAKPEQPRPKPPVAPADRDKYMEVLRKDTVAEAARPKFKLNSTSIDPSEIASTLPEATRKRMAITYEDAPPETLDPKAYLEDNKKPQPEQKKKISITFDDKADVNSFIETLPKSPTRKITISYMADSTDVNPGRYLKDNSKKPQEPEAKKKITLTFKNDEEVHAYMERLPKSEKSKITLSYNVDSNDLKGRSYSDATRKTTVAPAPVTSATPAAEVPEPPKPKIKLKFSDDMNINESAEVKSKYISMDPVTGHVRINLPDDITTHNYSIKFYDKEKHMVIEVPKLNAPKIILDKRNFQKKGQYKFTIKKDILELESGYINIY